MRIAFVRLRALFICCCTTQAPLQQWPPYASYVLFELWCEPPGQTTQHALKPSSCSVRVMYNGKMLRLEQFADSERGVPLPDFVRWVDRTFSSVQMAMQYAPASIPVGRCANGRSTYLGSAHYI